MERVTSFTRARGFVHPPKLASVVMALMTAALLLVAGSASATTTHPFEEAFGSAAQPSFGGASGLAVDQSSGDLLVIDSASSTVSRYNPDGTPAAFSGLGTHVIDGNGNGECATVPAACDETPQNGLSFGSPREVQIAVDNSGGATDGNIYVTQGSNHLVDIFGSDGKYLGQLTESSGGPLGESCGVAVDPGGNVYVGDFNNGVHKFVPSANPPVNSDAVATFTAVPFPCTLAAGAGSTAGFVFVDEYGAQLLKLDSSTGALQYVVSEGTNNTTSVDPQNGHVYVAKGSDVHEYDASGASAATEVSSFSNSSEVTGIAVRSSTGKVYVSRAESAQIEVFGTVIAPTTGAATNIGDSTATLHGSVNPNGVELEECKFEYGTSASYGQTAPCAETPAEIGAGFNDVPVHADLTGLAEGTTYHFRLVAKSAGQTTEGADEVFETLGPPGIEEAWAERVLRTEARLKAKIASNGSATTYHFEWGVTSGYGNSTAESGTGSAGGSKVVGAALEGLAPGTTYHWRVVATNATGTTEGPDRTFATYAPLSSDAGCPNEVFRTGPAALLPDCRAYEMVSPVDKNGGDVAFEEAGQSLLAQSSENGEKLVFSALKSFRDAPSAPFISQYLAGRGGAGWSTEPISPPRGSKLNIGIGFALGSSYKAFSSDLSIGWLRHDTDPPLAPGAPTGVANFYRRDNNSGAYEALSIGEPKNGNWRPEFQGATNDGSHTIFTINDALTPDAPDLGFEKQLYEWADGELRLVSVLPNGEPSPVESTAGSHYGSGTGELENAVDHALSDDGSRVFWSAVTFPASGGAIYMRVDGESTVPVSESVTTDDSRFWTASADGSKAIFAVEEGPLKGNLYEFDVDTQTPTLIAGEVLGQLGASDDASYLYFVSEEDLGAGAVAGEPNLYLHHAGDETFIAALSDVDVDKVNFGNTPSVINPFPSRRATRVAPDGVHIVFTSTRSLTGYDNTDTQSGEAVTEVYRYDAAAEELSCVSCNPSGARPMGARDVGGLQDSDHLWVASRIPVWQNQLYGSRALSDDGRRVFFDSFDSLVPEDANGKPDVYQWEASGSGTCEDAAGCISLISTGTSSEASVFMDASASGDDVFIATKSSIAAQDPGLIDVYDARVGGGFPPPSILVHCVGDACQSVPEPLQFPAPASASFRGAGNPSAAKARRSCRARSRRHGTAKPRSKRQLAKHCRRNRRRAGR
jgi:hypothetical protein